MLLEENVVVPLCTKVLSTQVVHYEFRTVSEVRAKEVPISKLLEYGMEFW
jgi:hypothetical protein